VSVQVEVIRFKGNSWSLSSYQKQKSKAEPLIRVGAVGETVHLEETHRSTY